MNTLLHGADIALQYFRGKQTGLWGLFGIIITILMVRFWDYIVPVFEFMGVVSFLDSMGLIVEDLPALTGYKILLAFLFGYFLLIVAGLILLAVYTIIISLTQSELGNKLLKASMYLIFFPFVFMYHLYRGIEKWKNKNEKKRDPEGVAEKLRLEKNKDIIDLLKNADVENYNRSLIFNRETELDALMKTNWDKYEELNKTPLVFKESNNVSLNVAINRLNQIPTIGDEPCLIATTYNRDFYLLLPRPQMNSEPKRLIGEKIMFTFKREAKYLKQKGYFNDCSLSYEFERNIGFNSSRVEDDFKELSEIELDNIEEIFDIKGIKTLKHIPTDYRKSRSYSTFVENEQERYFAKKENLKDMINNANTKEDFNRFVNEITQYNAWNEDVVYHIWASNKNNLI
ncbi:hypothetical protein CJ195_15525 [Bacillus sp. UMB0899]|nr:hypothetical protein CJ195_15525 [Bacillus sp. UMB0899]